MTRRSLDRQAVLAQLTRILAVKGAQARVDLLPALGISHATLTRLIAELGDQAVVMGKGRATQYSLRRPAPGLPATIPVYEILPSGKGRRLGELQPVQPRGYYFVSEVDGLKSLLASDMPYFLNDMRPQGYLGRLIPRRHPDLDLPADIAQWDSDTTLRYLTRQGWSTVGNLIVGDEAYALHLRDAREPRDIVEGSRELAYERLASDTLQHGQAGSSAGGEQPKFLVRRKEDAVALIVKFSPPVRESIGRRVADLLVAEHVALETLAEAGHPAARTSVVVGKSRVFLEVERFDRVGRQGRRGAFSLAALDDEFVGKANGDWSTITNELVAKKVVSGSVRSLVDRQRIFGLLTANSDMHRHNLSFFHSGTKIEGVCPAYDMQPMYFAPMQNQVIDRAFEPPSPGPSEGKTWRWATAQALTYWFRVGKDKRVSPVFRAIAAEARAKVETIQGLVELLPE